MMRALREDEETPKGCCQLCRQPTNPFSSIDWHPDCYIAYREFIEQDFIPLIRELAEKDPIMTLYAISPEFREDMAFLGHVH